MRITADDRTTREFIEATQKAVKAYQTFRKSLDTDDSMALTDCLTDLLEKADDFIETSIDESRNALSDTQRQGA